MASSPRTKDFAQACRDAGLVFIGPSPEIDPGDGQQGRRQGHHAQSRRALRARHQGADQSDAVMLKEAKKIGFPVMIKAVAGGGGRGYAAGRGCGSFQTRCVARDPKRKAPFRRSDRHPGARHSSIPGISKSRCSATAMATPSISASAIARCSAGTRS